MANSLTLRHLALVLIVGGTARAGAAQDPAELGGPSERADLLYFAGYPEQAYDLLTADLEDHPNDYDVLWRASRSAVVLGVRAVGVNPQNRWLNPAIVLGERAVAVRPDGVDGLYWKAAASGRRALNAGTGYAIELAQKVYDDTHAILALDSQHGGAHNVLGKLNYEVMSLSRIERFIGRVFMGNEALRDMSWENAERHLGRAVELWPDFVLFQLDWGALQEKRGRDERARAALTRALELPSVHPPDDLFKAQAQRLLSRLAARGRGTAAP